MLVLRCLLVLVVLVLVLLALVLALVLVLLVAAAVVAVVPAVGHLLVLLLLAGHRAVQPGQCRGRTLRHAQVSAPR